MVLVTTKLHVPHVRRSFVARDALVVQLAAGRDCRLSLVCAPAGWGKSVLLAQWHASEARSFAWVSLDPADDEPVRFWSYVVGALRTVVPGFGGAVLAALPNAGPGLVEVVLPRLINELAELPEPVVLVLDDYHVLTDELLHASVAYLLRHLPRTVQLVVASRADPPLPLARLRAAGELAEVRADQLRFDDRAATALLNDTLALDLDAGDVELLQERTEGWPAGLQLAALSLRGRADRPEFIRSLAGDDRQIGDYLHEVIEDASPPVREFLVRTSILERMCAPLCDAVTGGENGATLLVEAYRSNLFLVSLDDQGHWYRYHHLFRDLLLRELARRGPGLAQKLHAGAAAWHRSNGNVEEAIMHAIAAGQSDDAAELIALNWLETWDTNPRTVARWLEGLPEGIVEADARLCFARGWAAMFAGPLEGVEPAIAAAERAPLHGDHVDPLGTLVSKAAMLRAATAYLQGNIGRAREMAVQAQSNGATFIGALHGSMFHGMALYYSGDMAGAFEALERTVQTLPGPGFSQARLTSRAFLAHARLDAGEPEVAERLLQEAERLIDDYGLGEGPTASMVRSGNGRLLELKGDVAGANAAYKRALALAERGGWPMDMANTLLLHAALKRRRRDFGGARALTRDARRAVNSCPDPGLLAERLAKAERSLQFGSVSGTAPSVAVSAELSEREIAVLRLLATELSQREIGAQLFVSINTVKTHTRVLFRKLDVSNRAEAVERARDLGLL